MKNMNNYRCLCYRQTMSSNDSIKFCWNKKRTRQYIGRCKNNPVHLSIYGRNTNLRDYNIKVRVLKPKTYPIDITKLSIAKPKGNQYLFRRNFHIQGKCL